VRKSRQSAEAIVDTAIVRLHEACYSEAASDPFFSVERFTQRVRGYLKSPGFGLVLAEADGEPIGQCFGYALPHDSRWWQGLTTPVEPALTTETGHRTFALCELMVRPDWQQRGVARALHDELLHHRPEERATLLVREDNIAAQRAYASWGWRKIGKNRPFPDAPHYDALVLPLR
jgi:ribosomal protein S18 acetylase RimI-like enzyme